MSKNILALSILATCSALPFQAEATDSPQYPAYDFNPKVVYKDIGLIAASGSQSDPKYPAAHFQPKVLFQDKDLIEKHGNQKGSYPQ
jgi:hypothetical protein